MTYNYDHYIPEVKRLWKKYINNFDCVRRVKIREKIGNKKLKLTPKKMLKIYHEMIQVGIPEEEMDKINPFRLQEDLILNILIDMELCEKTYIPKTVLCNRALYINEVSELINYKKYDKTGKVLSNIMKILELVREVTKYDEVRSFYDKYIEDIKSLILKIKNKEEDNSTVTKKYKDKKVLKRSKDRKINQYISEERQLENNYEKKEDKNSNKELESTVTTLQSLGRYSRKNGRGIRIQNKHYLSIFEKIKGNIIERYSQDILQSYTDIVNDLINCKSILDIVNIYFRYRNIIPELENITPFRIYKNEETNIEFTKITAFRTKDILEKEVKNRTGKDYQDLNFKEQLSFFINHENVYEVHREYLKEILRRNV